MVRHPRRPVRVPLSGVSMRLSTVATLPAAVISTVGWSAADEMAMPRPIGSPLLGETCDQASDALGSLINGLGDISKLRRKIGSYPTYTHLSVRTIMRALGRLLSATRD